MAGWQPSTEGLQQLLGLFKASARADNAQHRAIQQQLTDFNAIPDYNNYLVFILNMVQEEGQVRQKVVTHDAAQQREVVYHGLEVVPLSEGNRITYRVRVRDSTLRAHTVGLGVDVDVRRCTS